MAGDLAAYFEKYSPPEYPDGSLWTAGDPVGRAMMELMVSGMSPAQQRVMARLGELVDAETFQARGRTRGL